MFLVPLTRHAAPLPRALDRLLDDRVLERLTPTAQPDVSAGRTPALDIRETDRGYTVLAEMPGVRKEQVKVQIDGRRVSLSADIDPPAPLAEGERLVYRERQTQAFARSFTLPVELDQAESTARLEHGVLTLQLVKRGAPTAAAIRVQ